MIKAYSQGEIDVIDLSDPENVCEDLPIGPFDTILDPQSLHGTFVNGKLTVCGVNVDQGRTRDFKELKMFLINKSSYLCGDWDKKGDFFF